MDCASFVLSSKTENIINNLKILEDIFDFSNLDENHDLFSNKKKLLVILKLKLLKIFGEMNSLP